jgi:hypothetical protein
MRFYILVIVVALTASMSVNACKWFFRYKTNEDCCLGYCKADVSILLSIQDLTSIVRRWETEVLLERPVATVSHISAFAWVSML